MSIPFAAAAEGYHGNLAKLETLSHILSEERPAGEAGDYDARMQSAADEFCEHLLCVPLPDAASSLRNVFFHAPYDQQQQILGVAHGYAQKMNKDMGETLANNLVLARIFGESEEKPYKDEADNIHATVPQTLKTMSLTPYLKTMDRLAEWVPDENCGESPFSDGQIAMLRDDFEFRLAKCLGNESAELPHLRAFEALAFKLTHDEHYDAATEAITAKIEAVHLKGRQGTLDFKKG